MKRPKVVGAPQENGTPTPLMWVLHFVILLLTSGSLAFSGGQMMLESNHSSSAMAPLGFFGGGGIIGVGVLYAVVTTVSFSRLGINAPAVIGLHLKWIVGGAIALALLWWMWAR